jgi:beta-glucosidase
MTCLFLFATVTGVTAQQKGTAIDRQAGAPIEQRIDDLLKRMTLEEKVRRLDLYAAAGTLEDRHTGKDHLSAAAAFLPDNAEKMWGALVSAAFTTCTRLRRNPVPFRAG